VRDFEPTLEEQFGDISEAQLVAETPQHGEQHGVGGVLEVVEWRAGSFVEAAATGATVESSIAECGTAPALRRCGRLTVRTGHQYLLVAPRTRLRDAGEP